MMFGLFRFSGGFVDASEEVVGGFEGIGSIGVVESFDGFFELSAGEVIFAFAGEAFAKEDEGIDFEGGVCGGLLQEGDSAAEFFDVSGGESEGEFVFAFEVCGVVFDAEGEEFDFASDEVDLEGFSFFGESFFGGVGFGAGIGFSEVITEHADLDFEDEFFDFLIIGRDFEGFIELILGFPEFAGDFVEVGEFEQEADVLWIFADGMNEVCFGGFAWCISGAGLSFAGASVFFVGVNGLGGFFDGDIAGGFGVFESFAIEHGDGIDAAHHAAGFVVGGHQLVDSFEARAGWLVIAAFEEEVAEFAVVVDVILVEFNGAFECVAGDAGVFERGGRFAEVEEELGIPGVNGESFFGGGFDAFPVFGEAPFFDAAANAHESHAGHGGASAVITVGLADAADASLAVEDVVGNEADAVGEAFDCVSPVFVLHGFCAFAIPVSAAFFAFVHESCNP